MSYRFVTHKLMRDSVDEKGKSDNKVLHEMTFTRKW